MRCYRGLSGSIEVYRVLLPWGYLVAIKRLFRDLSTGWLFRG
jgi:hypothetical protein